MAKPDGASGEKPRPPAHYLGYGLTWAASTILFMLGGQALDGVLGTAPLLTMLGALVGAAAGFWYMYRNLVVEREAERKDADE